jgi:chromosome segregation ATPase
MTEQINVSEEEIKKIDEQVAQKQAEELKRLSDATAKEIETKVRKELTDQQEKEKLSMKLSDLENQNKKIREEMETKLKAERDAFEARLSELEARRKGLASNESPFKEDKGNIRNGIDVDKLDYKKIEEESREAFKRYHRLPSDWGIKP